MVCHGLPASTEQPVLKSCLYIFPLCSTGCVCVCLGPEASVQDEIRVMCQALWLRSMLSSQPLRGASTEQREPLPFLSVHHQRNIFCLFFFNDHYTFLLI